MTRKPKQKVYWEIIPFSHPSAMQKNSRQFVRYCIELPIDSVGGDGSKCWWSSVVDENDRLLELRHIFQEHVFPDAAALQDVNLSFESSVSETSYATRLMVKAPAMRRSESNYPPVNILLARLVKKKKGQLFRSGSWSTTSSRSQKTFTWKLFRSNRVLSQGDRMEISFKLCRIDKQFPQQPLRNFHHSSDWGKNMETHSLSRKSFKEISSNFFKDGMERHTKSPWGIGSNSWTHSGEWMQYRIWSNNQLDFWWRENMSAERDQQVLFWMLSRRNNEISLMRATQGDLGGQRLVPRL